jgi:hypothetical protein
MYQLMKHVAYTSEMKLFGPEIFPGPSSLLDRHLWQTDIFERKDMDNWTNTPNKHNAVKQAYNYYKT